MSVVSRRIRLREHGRVDGLALTPREVEVLSDPRARLQVLARPGGKFTIQAAEVVGTLVGSGLRVAIEPKVPISRLMFLLGFASGAFAFTDETEVAASADVAEAMGQVFSETLGRALRGGAIGTYVRRSDDLVQPRGRIDFVDLTRRRFGAFPPVPCEFDEFTLDHEANQRLLAATDALLRAPETTPAVRIALRSMLSRIGDVTLLRFDARRLRPLVQDRRFAQYRAALSLADFVIRRASFELNDGRATGMGLLVDMNTIYEDFVAEGLRRAASSRLGRWERHTSVSFDLEDRVKLEPDLVWRERDGRPALVLDVKYKRVAKAPNDDLYQIQAYCLAMRVSRGVLVYPAVEERRVTVTHGGPTIELVMLDPDGSPSCLRERLEALAARLTS